VSSTVKDLVAGSEIVFSDEGEHELNGVRHVADLLGAGLIVRETASLAGRKTESIIATSPATL
jgi:hypothetical protein